MRKVIGIDIGGTKIKGAIVDENGQIEKKYSLATPEQKGESVFYTVCKVIDQLFDKDISGIGIGSAGFVDSDQGIILFAGNIPGWSGMHLKERLEKIYPVPVMVENDANLAAVCEKWIGSARPYDTFLMLTMGTGLGGAIYHNKIGLWKGCNYQAGELGHMILYPKGRICTCGQKGCAEKYCSGSSLALNYRERTGIIMEGPEILSNLAYDENAVQALDTMMHDFAYYLATLKNIFDPEAIIIGGGFIESSYIWWDMAIHYYQLECNRPQGTDIIPAQYLNEAGIIGAGKIVLDKVKGSTMDDQEHRYGDNDKSER